MKRLYLFRHAKSSWKDHALNDFDRPLNKRGIHDAPIMGRRLSARKVCPDLIVSSPAKRALTTAQIVAGEIGYPEKRIVKDETIYEAGSPSLLRLIQQTDDSVEELMLFGHNPGFTILAEALCRHPFDNVPTCGIVCIDFDVTSWQEIEYGNGTLIFFDYPKNTQAL